MAWAMAPPQWPSAGCNTAATLGGRVVFFLGLPGRLPGRCVPSNRPGRRFAWAVLSPLAGMKACMGVVDIPDMRGLASGWLQGACTGQWPPQPSRSGPQQHNNANQPMPVVGQMAQLAVYFICQWVQASPCLLVGPALCAFRQHFSTAAQ